MLNRLEVRSLFMIGLAALAVSLIGCTSGLKHQTTDSIALAVRRTTTSKPGTSEWTGPALQMNQWRNQFYGYDTVSYHLFVRKRLGSRTYGLHITADYGGNARHYKTAQFSGHFSHSTTDYRHEVGRCQFFNSLVYACLFRDRFNVPISASELVQGSATGLRFTLQSQTLNFETLDLPANYVRGFLAGFGEKFSPNRSTN